MNDPRADPSFSYETSEELYLFTSLTAGSSHIITATSRMETILKANRIPFKAVDCATDEKARRIWGRRAAGKKLPGLVKEGQVLADLEGVEEWNEYGEIKQVLGSEASTTKPVLAPSATPVATTKENEKPTSNATPETSQDKAPQSVSTTNTERKTAEGNKTIEQLQAQLGNEAAAVAALHSKDAPKSILEKVSKRQNSADLLTTTADPDNTTSSTATENPTTSEQSKSLNDTRTHQPSISFAQEPSRDDVAGTDAKPSAPNLPEPAEPTTTTESISTGPSDPVLPSSSTEPLPVLPDAGRAPRASVTAGDLAVSTSPPSSLPRRSLTSDDSDSPTYQPLSGSPPKGESEAAPADSAAAAAETAVLSPSSSASLVSPTVPSGATVIEQRHRGSSISLATEEEVRDAEARNVIIEEDEGADAQPCT